MKSLYLRIWLTVLAALSLFALASGWLVQRHMTQERERFEAVAHSRAEAWADLLERSLPPAHAPPEQQVAALSEWSQRLRLPLALDDAAGRRIGVSESWARREAEGVPIARRGLPVRLDDGRTLWIARFGGMRRPGAGMGERPGMGREGPPPGPWWEAPRIFGLPGLPGLPGLGALSEGAVVLALVVLLFLAVAAGAWPVVRRLTRRLEALKQGMEAFGAGALHLRVAEDGRDEVAAVAASFNRAAARVETLVRSHQSLLGNASHELRSPLARLKMAVSMLEDAAPAQRERLRQEIHANIGELDALVEEVLLASRLDAAQDALQKEPVDLLAMAAEEAARVQATVEAQGLDTPDGANAGVGMASGHVVRGDERLLRRALRNLLENARRYGGDDVQVVVRPVAPAGASAGSAADLPGLVEVRVCDRGPGVPEAWRERIFEPFLRLPGHAEHEGGVGLGLSLVRQIATRHGGQVRCEPREGGGSCFSLTLPV